MTQPEGLYASDNWAYLDACGYDPDDPGEDIVHPPWTPTPAQLAAYKKRELQLATGNLSLMVLSSEPRRQLTITNDIEPAYEVLTERQAERYRTVHGGYGAIGVWVGGPEQEDCLHSLTTFGEAKRKGVVLALAGVARPVRTAA